MPHENLTAEFPHFGNSVFLVSCLHRYWQ